MGEKQQENKGRKTEKNKEKKIELEKDEMEFHKSKKKDKVVSKDVISDDVVGALKIAGVEGEENTNARSNGRKDSVDDSEERKEKKKKRKEKKKKEGVDGTSSEVENSEAEKRDELVKGYENRGGVPVENGEEERAKKNKKKKKEKEGSDNEVKNSMTNEETRSKERNHLDGKIKEHGKLAVKEKNLDKIRDNAQKGAENGDVAEVSNDKDGGKSKKKKKKKIREREDAYDEVEDEMEVDEEGDKSKMKKKRKMENDDEMKTNEEGDRIKKKERKRDSVSGEVENKMKTNEERVESKKKKERKKENSFAEVEDEMQTNEEGEKSKKKERKRENASNEVEDNMKTNEEGEKSKKKKRGKKEIVSDDVEDQMKTDEEVDKSKKTRKREYVSADVEDTPEIDERDKSKKNKERKREIVSGDVEDKSDELGKGDGGSKDKKKKGKAEKQVSSGEAHKGKAIIEKDIEVADTFENPTPQGKSKRVSFSDHVEVFLDDSPSGGESISDQGDGLVQGKRFTPKEDDLLKNAVLGYIEDHNLGDDGLQMILNCISYPEVKGCWKEIAAALPWRPANSAYYRGHVLFERDDTRKWTAEEYEYIRDFVNEHGSDWKRLSTELKKHRLHCKDTWRRIKQINLRKGCWAQEEYQTLFDLVNMDLHMRALEERKSKHGMLRDNICWGAISDRLSTRSDATCCEKWYSQLTSPMVQQGLWSDTDDYRLVNALSSVDAPCLEDVDWDNLLDHRDGDICRKRWNQMVKHIGEYGLKTFSEQVEVLANRYSPDCIEAREEFDSKPILP